ncbi:hydroxyphenylacetyl-CoA thioesterase PaaI [Hoeflea sp. TYP-13]|uniref:hydroxyphenylacetyl-CoA thioesterase PaaI n=1 Tax=Hoeflea sp. TYP-13 TaxID=3230023 RepID=UPI0034C63AE6
MTEQARSVSDMSADELAQACAQSMWANDSASQHMGMKLEAVTAGTATLSMVVKDFMTNGHDICHGGFVFTLADSAFAFACNGYNQNAVAQHCAVSFLLPVKSGETLTAVAREINRSGRSGIYDIRVTRDDGETVAEFRGHSRTVKGTHLPVQD